MRQKRTLGHEVATSGNGSHPKRFYMTCEAACELAPGKDMGVCVCGPLLYNLRDFESCNVKSGAGPLDRSTFR